MMTPQTLLEPTKMKSSIIQSKANPPKVVYHYLNLNQSLVSMFTVKIHPFWDTNEKEKKKKKNPS